jgi:alpha-L-fucosidase 2
MIRLLICAVLLLPVARAAGSTFEMQTAGREWADGFPIGNGALGGMVMGGVASDRVALNHNRLWRRSMQRREFRVAGKLAEFRRLFLAGRYEEAGRLIETDVMVTGGTRYQYVNPFQPLGDLWLEFHHQGEGSDYRRRLDMESGLVEVSYRVGNTRYRREYFASAPEDGVLVVRVIADAHGVIDATLRLDRIADPDCRIAVSAAGNEAALAGVLKEGFPFAAVAQVRSNGQVQPRDRGLRISNATELTIVLTMATGAEASDPAAWCRKRLATAASFKALRDRHIADHAQFFRRVRLDIGDQQPPGAPYDKLFDFGRYLLISGSRPGVLPMNLQGIWNQDLHPPWDCDYHMDLNLEYNYWPAEVCGLSELHAPFFDWAEARIPDGRKMARDVFGCRGIFFPIVADATGLGNLDNLCYSWPGAAGWMAQQFWRHWEYSGDKEFLARRALPFLKEVAAFYADYLFRDGYGQYVILPSLSPENGIKGRKGWIHYTTVSSTMDLEIAREVLTHALLACETLGLKPPEADQWLKILQHLPLPGIDAEGRLQEWTEDVVAADPAHRTLSPLWGLFPGDRIASVESPVWKPAARKLLEFRLASGDGNSNGWVFPWRAGLFARLNEGDRALEQLDKMARCCVNDNLLPLVTDWRGQGRTANWFGNKKILMIEAGLATPAVIAEMLMQSHGDVIRILPALPARWPNGRVTGLAARGGFTVDIEWSAGRASRVRIHSRLGNRCRLLIGDRERDFPTVAGKSYEFSGAGRANPRDPG